MRMLAVGSRQGPHAPPLRGSLPPRGGYPRLGRPDAGSYTPLRRCAASPQGDATLRLAKPDRRRPLGGSPWNSNTVHSLRRCAAAQFFPTDVMPHRSRGFTLLELMVVLAIVALATAGATLALRDSNATRLEREALRLAAMLESARAQSRTSGIPVVWRTLPQGFEFLGLRPLEQDPDSLAGPKSWLDPQTRAQVVRPVNTATLVLGPEPLIASQRVVLLLGERQLTLATDGLSAFAVISP